MAILVFALVMLFVLIQSIYGAGILIFGVPVLMLYGLDYLEIIGILVPSSITISVLQLFKCRDIKSKEIKILPIAIIGIVIGLSTSIFASRTDIVPTIIGTMMLLATLLRSNAAVKSRMAILLTKYRLIFHFLNAILHGFSNLGGILLTFYSASVHKEKIHSMHCTALFYLVYAGSQIIILFWIGQGSLFQSGFFYAPFTAALYLILGQKTFSLISQRQFDKLATLFFFIAGLIFVCGFAVF
jgi:uncharacterized protein